MKINIEEFTIKGISITDENENIPSISDEMVNDIFCKNDDVLIDDLLNKLNNIDLEKQIRFVDKTLFKSKDYKTFEYITYVTLSKILHTLNDDIIGHINPLTFKNSIKQTLEFINKSIEPKYPDMAKPLMESVEKYLILCEKEIKNKDKRA